MMSSSSRVPRYSITVASMSRPCRCCKRKTRQPHGPLLHRPRAARAHTAKRRRGSEHLSPPTDLEREPCLANPSHPVRVSSGPSCRAAATRASSSSRPMKLVGAPRQSDSRRTVRREAGRAVGGRRGRHRESVGVRPARSGWDRHPVLRRAAHASADRCRAPRACRPLRYWASINWPAMRSSSGCLCSADESSPSNSCVPPDAQRERRFGPIQPKVAPPQGKSAHRSPTGCPAWRTGHHATALARARTAPAACGRFGRPGFGHQAAESIQVDSREIGLQHIAAGFACDRHIVDPVEQSSQPGQISRQGVSHAMRRLVGPHAIDELFRRDRPVRVDQQGNQNASLAGMPDLQGMLRRAAPRRPRATGTPPPRLQPPPGGRDYGRILALVGS